MEKASALRLGAKRIRTELKETEGWKLRGKQISKLFVFSDFVHAIRFINRVARLAEGMNHHPDIAIQYNKVELVLTTHDEGGLTMKDFRLARKTNGIVRTVNRA